MWKNIVILLQKLKLNNQRRDICLNPPVLWQKQEQKLEQVKTDISQNQNGSTQERTGYDLISQSYLQFLFCFKCIWGASLVAQWLRIHLLVQETWVQSPIGEGPTCRGVTKPVHHNLWACALELGSHSHWSLCALKPMLCNKRSRHSEKPARGN